MLLKNELKNIKIELLPLKETELCKKVSPHFKEIMDNIEIQKKRYKEQYFEKVKQVK